jgi:DNA-binding SARP family transcriptional activator
MTAPSPLADMKNEASARHRHRPTGAGASGPVPTLWARGMGDLALYRKEDDPEPLLRCGKSLALLSYVALSPGRRAPRQHLAELLWPDQEHRSRHHCLRQSLYRLRQATPGPPLVRSRGQEIRVGRGARFDFLEGEAALSAGEYGRAEQLLRGDFLEGLSIPEAREFERWAESKREGFCAAWVQAARTLAGQRLAKCDLGGAEEIAEALVARRPFDEESIGLLMATLAAGGRYGLAFSRFRTYAHLLWEELGEKPSRELDAYARDLRRCAGSAALRPNTKAIFVGRSEEWSLLEEAWRTAGTGRQGLILLRGRARTGKTSLLNEFSYRVRAGGAVVLPLRCSGLAAGAADAPDRSMLSLPWSSPGKERLELSLLAELARLAPKLREMLSDLPAPDPTREEGPGFTSPRYLALANSLRDLAGRDGLLLTIDDLHLADSPSLRLIQFLAWHLADTRALVLVAYRPQELGPEGGRSMEDAVSRGLARTMTLGGIE